MIEESFHLWMGMPGGVAIALVGRVVVSVPATAVERWQIGGALPGENMARAARSLGLRTACAHDCEWQM